MASTNQQEPNNPSCSIQERNLAEQTQQHQLQQQELIKLLTQHFHNQFQQLTANNININPQNGSQPTQSSNSQLHQVAPAVYQTQQPLGPSLDLMGGFDLSNLSSISDSVSHPNSQSPLFPTHSHLRSQASQPPLPPPTFVGTTGGLIPPAPMLAESLLDFSQNQANVDPYLMNEINLFNVLGLNGHLMLSLQQQQQQHHNNHLQQQSMFQSARRQSELAENMIISNQKLQVNNRYSRRVSTTNENSIQHNPSSENSGNNNHFNLHNQTPHAGKELLKFSINTILGTNCSAGKSGSDGQMGDSRQTNNNIHLLSNVNEQSNKLGLRLEETNDQQSRSLDEGLDCDQSSHSDSESSDESSTTLDTSTPPTHQSSTTCASSTTSQLIFGQAQKALRQMASNHRSPGGLTTNHEANALMCNINNTNDGTNIHNSNMGMRQQFLSRHHYHNNNNNQISQSLVSNNNNHPLPQFLTAASSSFPWTVAARGKPRRGMMRRAVFSDSQRVGLEKRFQLQKYISKPDRKKLAEKLGLRDSQVKIWFQNRRMKWRNSKERELLSTGGSREQTLPTRNNPNPDLSDVGANLKRKSAATTLLPPTTITVNAAEPMLTTTVATPANISTIKNKETC